MLIADTKAIEMGLNVSDFHEQIERQEEAWRKLIGKDSCVRKICIFVWVRLILF